ncbi:MAG TPA: DMT family transporter [Burkholderiaceae bacterium]|nr:DMT family transporter [Burkholderiaceae bacterium]
MRGRDLADLLLLAAVWGASFLFMRIAVPQFGPLPLMALRCAIGAACLLPLLALRGDPSVLRRRAGALAAVGVLNSALPFALFAYATLSLSAGFTSLLNATTPLWGAIVAAAWLGERPSRRQLAGLAIGFAGVLMLVRGRVSSAPDGDGLAIAAALAATLSYGVAASFARRRLSGVDPLANATGSQVGAAIALAPFAIASRPAAMPDAGAWLATIALGVACTGLAYVLYFRLIARTGAARAMTVTFLIPVFGILWGALFLDETVTAGMLVAGAIVLLGTALGAGAIGGRAPARRPAG